MERTLPPNVDYFPISMFAIITPLAMAAMSLMMLCFNLCHYQFQKGDRHTKYQLEAGMQPAKYYQSNLGDLKVNSKPRMASSNIVPGASADAKSPVNSNGQLVPSLKTNLSEIMKQPSTKYSSSLGSSPAKEEKPSAIKRVNSSKGSSAKRVASSKAKASKK